MASKSSADEMHDALVTSYGQGSISDLLRQYYVTFPSSGKHGTSAFLTHMKSRGALGASHNDIMLDFWKNRR